MVKVRCRKGNRALAASGPCSIPQIWSPTYNPATRNPTINEAMAPLAALLAPQFTVFNFDRRGRGESGDTQPYAVQREIEDIDALILPGGESTTIGVVAIRLTRVLADKLLEKTGITWTSDDEREKIINGMVGEIVNIISAHSATKLVDYKITISVPIVVQGTNHTISWPDQQPILAIPFTTPIGHFLVNVSLFELPQAYRV